MWTNQKNYIGADHTPLGYHDRILLARRVGIPPNRDGQVEAVKQYAALKQSVTTDLQRLLADFSKQAIPASTFEARMKTSLREVYPRAFRLGMYAAGWPPLAEAPIDREFLAGFKEEEWRFVRGFVADMAAGRGRMPYTQRLALYLNTIDSVWWAGHVAAQPDGSRIYWRLSEAEHCEQCVDLATHSPYTKETLPFQPRSGHTTCLCITTPESRVLTDRGPVPIAQVQVGDWVWTHMGRWRPVFATSVNALSPHHEFAEISAPTGAVVGCTTDHRWMTEEGWKTAEDISKDGLLVCQNSAQAFGPFPPTDWWGGVSLLRNKRLYDLSVQDDHSFIIEGLISHNSNCKCYLEFSLPSFTEPSAPVLPPLHEIPQQLNPGLERREQARRDALMVLPSGPAPKLSLVSPRRVVTPPAQLLDLAELQEPTPRAPEVKQGFFSRVKKMLTNRFLVRSVDLQQGGLMKARRVGAFEGPNTLISEVFYGMDGKKIDPHSQEYANLRDKDSKIAAGWGPSDYSDFAVSGERNERSIQAWAATKPKPESQKKSAKHIGIGATTGNYIVVFPYDADLVAAVKRIPGARYQASAKNWMVPKAEKERLEKFAQQHGFTGMEVKHGA